MKNSQLLNSVVILFCLLLFSSCKKNTDAINSIGDRINQYSLEGNQIYSDNVKSYSEDITTTFNFLPSSTTNQIVKHEYYTLSYNEKYEQAEWVAYELKKNYLKNNSFKRPFFIEDPKVKTGSADWRNYKNSGYDKGHLCPAGDMEFVVDAYNDTFFTSNISPQLHDFNSGVWNRLEQKIRYWATKYDGIYVVTGGVLESSLKTIGKEKVSVPEFFYKVLLDNSGGNFKMIAFLVPNSESNRPLYSFVVSVDRIEKMTGIDFFPKLNDKTENQLEKSSDYKNWSFN
ncbi:DNA/RNA non-specific endonuclease [Flavobacterium gawalongense]|uniref:DNA/RNA non-specific endonuclease n=1 Tax=Flavobacterium gawalongense TaxID=2594432 RepID=A0ABY3CMJ3_9FLAO|nr:DNA/RNA non-specific endonuclease [Flavobacterium gawalongense]TRX02445.1 DNA/RNA non-specific endonuclease [Flavobacterium gawalongense]TRX07726.1 DNA/RNA non-specific endonuclease [Flavobacterium gawalongense]